MRSYYKLLLVMAFFILSACNSSEQLKPIKEESIDFDIKTAIQMVEKKEKIIIDLALREKVSITEYEELEKSFDEEFGKYSKDILSIFFLNTMESVPESESGMYVIQDTFYPTVFHEGITVTNAVIDKSYYENEFFNVTSLRIMEEYVGDDEKLKDWKREYIFTPNEDGEWEVHGFSGVMNFLGEEYSMNYLELKK
ncbi:hypothetical protein EJP82_18750 [Paenibacillus anaericanus]|uniref:DUF5105 domain-containing protein n=1 Tax=Paenibacillus anaericanus TaxID=170367 RepID=A0A3S1BNW8_9BACL|nr:hypothetical protein [Paenibacillus anaericanus]RUT43973.1 hypothetical protein EJP82_18750 [Paenibacillus anaericanus]